MSFRKNILFVLTLSLLVTESLWASSNGAQTGRSGRPGDGAGCTYCHTAVSDPALSPTITFSQSEDTLSVGESLVFNLDIESNDNTKSGFGFNIAVADTAVGVFATSASVRLNNADNSEVTHQQTYNYSDGAGSIALQFTPASVGEHTLYVVLNEVNGEWNISDDAWSVYTWIFNVSDGTSDPVDAGSSDGSVDGTSDPVDAGSSDGAADGTSDPVDAGSSDGTADGTSDSVDAGSSDGTADGTSDSVDAGSSDGSSDGTSEPTDAGSIEGSGDGTIEPVDAGTSDGASEGTSDGSDDSSGANEEEGGCGCNSRTSGNNMVSLLGLFFLGCALRRRRM